MSDRWRPWRAQTCARVEVNISADYVSASIHVAYSYSTCRA